jgi:hypothetical protein
MKLKLEIPFEEIKARFPGAVSDCCLQAAAKGLVASYPAIMTWDWWLEWGVRVKNTSFVDLIKPRKPSKNTFASLQKNIKKNAMVHLVCRPAPRRFFYAKLIDVPQEVLNYYAPLHREQVHEEKRIANLTPAQRDVELQECLRGLRAQTGFVILRP